MGSMGSIQGEIKEMMPSKNVMKNCMEYLRLEWGRLMRQGDVRYCFYYTTELRKSKGASNIYRGSTFQNVEAYCGTLYPCRESGIFHAGKLPLANHSCGFRAARTVTRLLPLNVQVNSVISHSSAPDSMVSISLPSTTSVWSTS